MEVAAFTPTAWAFIGAFVAACVSSLVGFLYFGAWMLNIRDDKRQLVNFVAPLLFLNAYLTTNGIRYRNRAGLFFLISALLLGTAAVIHWFATGAWPWSGPICAVPTFVDELLP